MSFEDNTLDIMTAEPKEIEAMLKYSKYDLKEKKKRNTLNLKGE